MLASANTQIIRNNLMDLFRENQEDLPARVVQDKIWISWMKLGKVGLLVLFSFQGEACATETNAETLKRWVNDKVLFSGKAWNWGKVFVPNGWKKKERGEKKEGKKSIVLQSREKGIRENYTSVNIWMNYTVCAISISFTHDDAELSLPADKC